MSSQENGTTHSIPTREQVEGLVEEGKVSLVDSDENLDLFCYTRCSSQDSPLLKACRGVVFCGNELVLNAFPYTPEYNESEVDSELINVERCRFFDSYEGTLLRIFYYGGKWYVSTHRKLNAFRSKWASRHDSFGDIFVRALKQTLDKGLDEFTATLDPERQYMILIRNTAENRIVSQPPTETEPFLYHVGTFTNSVLSLNDSIGLPKPTEHTFDDISALVSYVQNIDPNRLQGLIVFDNGRQFKVLNKMYQTLFRARGNEPSLNYRYLQVRMDTELSNIFRSLYPEAQKNFDRYEEILRQIAKEIHTAYMDRFVHKKYVVVAKERYVIVSKCHEWHCADRSRNLVTLDKVLEVMNEQTPTLLNKMIRPLLIRE